MDNKVEVKVTWGFAWALWWRWMLMSLVLTAIIIVPMTMLMVALGLTARY